MAPWMATARRPRPTAQRAAGWAEQPPPTTPVVHPNRQPGASPGRRLQTSRAGRGGIAHAAPAEAGGQPQTLSRRRLARKRVKPAPVAVVSAASPQRRLRADPPPPPAFTAPLGTTALVCGAVVV